MHDRQSADSSFKKQSQKLLQTRLRTVQSGADVCYDLVAALFLQSLRLPDKIRFLVMTGYPGIADIETFLRLCSCPVGKIKSAVSSGRAY